MVSGVEGDESTALCDAPNVFVRTLATQENVCNNKILAVTTTAITLVIAVGAGVGIIVIVSYCAQRGHNP
jgi:hypothetical protein